MDIRYSMLFARGPIAGIVNNLPGVIRAGLGSGADMQAYLPSIVLSQEYGLKLVAAVFGVGTPVSLSIIGQYREVQTTNIIADVVNEGDANAAIVVGAHLDSVAHGAGINDNGCVQPNPKPYTTFPGNKPLDSKSLSRHPECSRL